MLYFAMLYLQLALHVKYIFLLIEIGEDILDKFVILNMQSLQVKYRNVVIKYTETD